MWYITQVFEGIQLAAIITLTPYRPSCMICDTDDMLAFGIVLEFLWNEFEVSLLVSNWTINRTFWAWII